jgi:predicted transposase YbfD/YdcC
MSALCRLTEPAARVEVTDPARCDDLLAHLRIVPDPRKPRGVRHPLCALLALAAAAVLSGARSLSAIGEWAADTSEPVLAALGVRAHPRTGVYQAPHESTLRRGLQLVDPDAVDDALAAWVASRRTDADTMEGVALDGKTVRGARDHTDEHSRAPHLLAALSHRDGTVLAQRAVDGKSNEITAVRPLLPGLDLAGKLITADALHTQRELADWLVTAKNADYLFIVKANQPTLLAAVAAALAGTNAQFADTTDVTTDRGHGRTEKRTIRTVPATDIDFPHAGQIFRIRRDRGGLDGVWTSKEIVFGITSLPADRAGPPQIASYARGHWSIEALHHIRDVTFGEDHSQVRTGNTPRIMAALRNLAISALRTTGVTNIAKALRHNARDPQRPLGLLGLPSRTT